MSELKRTPLYEAHVDEGAKLVDFGGFEMPVRYTSDKKEHLAVRQSCGLFDVSHMGEVFIEGDDALDAVDHLFTNDPRSIRDGQAMYAGLLNENGGFVDDCVVYRFSTQRFMVCVNASNREKDFGWMRLALRARFPDVSCIDRSDDYAQLALQGPDAETVLASMTDLPLNDIGFYHFAVGSLRIGSDDVEAIVSRTGYTGEDGFELYLAPAHALALWKQLRTNDAGVDVVACGLSARDTLRLEAGMALYGNDINDDTTPLEAGLSFIVKLQSKATGAERHFIGADALRRQKADGVGRRLRGVQMLERGIPRAGYPVVDADGNTVGSVTSGTQAPHLKVPIAMAYIDTAHAAFDHELAIVVREKPVRAQVKKLPFYRRAR